MHCFIFCLAFAHFTALSLLDCAHATLSGFEYESLDHRYLVRRQQGDQRPRYLALSSTVNSELTLLQNKNSSILTAGPANRYTDRRLPPSQALQGYFYAYDDNVFAPDNLGIRRFDQRWAIGELRTKDFQCLHATLHAPYVFVDKCANGTLKNKEGTWVNWGPEGEEGNGGFIEPYGTQDASDFINGNSPSFKKSWGFSNAQAWKTSGRPIITSKKADPKTHLTVFLYDSNGPLVTTCYEELR